MVDEAVKATILDSVLGVEDIIPEIIGMVLSRAVNEKDRDRAAKIFELARSWNTTDHVTFDPDEYLESLETLQGMCTVAGHEAGAHRIANQIAYFSDNWDEFLAVLADLKRDDIHAGLRTNFMNN